MTAPDPEPVHPRSWRPAVLGVIAMALASFGGMAAVTALGIQVFKVERREFHLGLLGLAEFLPSIAFVLITGIVADRFDRRRVVAVVYSFEILVFIGLAAYVRDRPTSVMPFFVFAALYGTTRSFGAPAMRALIPAAAPPGQLARVVATLSLAWQGSAIIGPVVGALANRASRQLPYEIAAVCFIGSVVLVCFIPRSIGRAHLLAPEGTKQERPTLASALEGFRFIRRTPVLLGAITLDLFAVLFGGAVALLPAIVEKILKVDDVWVGYLRAAGGAGAAVVTLFLAVRPVSRHVGQVLLVSVGLFGAATVLLGVTRSVWIALIAFVLLNAGDSVSVFVRTTLVPLVTPPEQRGRVLATENVFIGASNELGAFESGMDAALFGTVAAVVSGGVLTLVVVAFFALRFTALRDVDRFEDIETSAAPAT